MMKIAKSATRLAAVAAASTALAGLSACSTNPYTGQSQFILVDQAQLAQAAAASWQDIKAEERISNDAALNRRARTVAGRVIQAAGLHEQNWEIVVFDSDERNAFALPGGRIGVYRGMMEFASSDAELATVISHEVAHVVARHAAERYSQQVGTAVGAQVVGGALGGAENADQYAKVFGVGAQLGVLLPYSRAHERQADLLGVDYMTQAGYDPYAAVRLWQKMAQSGGAGGPSFLSTHPDPGARARDIEAYIQQKNYS